MKYLLFTLISLLLFTSNVYSAKWEDCGIPLTRHIYYQSVVVSPSSINIADPQADRKISVNVNVNLQNYKLVPGVQIHLKVTKGEDTYVETDVGDLCSILESANQKNCPLEAGAYSFTYLYELPPLPTGNYTARIVTYENITGTEIGCLSVVSQVIGLGLDACTYTSSFSADLAGTAHYDGDTIQIGPWGPNGEDLGFLWGTFKNVLATPDLVGYNTNGFINYVWGITGSTNSTSSGDQLFEGTMVIGYRPDPNNNENAQLVQQGAFSWTMTKTNSNPPYIFQSGTFELLPKYFFPNNFPYPLDLGNLAPFPVSTSSDGSVFTVKSSKSWCMCNCELGGIGKDDGLLGDKSSSDSMSGFKKGTIAICVLGSLLIIAAIIVVIRMSRATPKPVIYDDNDLLDPQKPDYGTIAINEAFEEEDREFN